MCIAVPGEITKLFSDKGSVRVLGIETIVNLQLIEEAQVGDYVLIHAGCALEKINKEYYEELATMFTDILKQQEDLYG